MGIRDRCVVVRVCAYLYMCLYLCLMFVSGRNVCTFVYARCVCFCVHLRVRKKICDLALSLLSYVGGGLATTSAPIALGLQVHMAMFVFLHWCQVFELWFPCLRQVLVPKKSNFKSWKNAFDSLKFSSEFKAADLPLVCSGFLICGDSFLVRFIQLDNYFN